MEVFDRQGSPAYLAVSYCWGPPEPSSVIKINGDDARVTENLLLFLSVYALRHPFDYLWVDQLCINQNDILERNSQVEMMKDTYRNATCVLIWLGPDRITKELSLVTEHMRAENEGWNEPLEVYSSWVFEYWKRLWIVQEFILAKDRKIYFGNRAITFKRYFQSGGGKPSPVVHHLYTWVNSKELMSPKTVLDYWAANKCKDPWDKCFGLQALFPDDWKIKVDYAKSLEDVYLELASLFARLSPEGVGLLDGVRELELLAERMGNKGPSNNLSRKDFIFWSRDARILWNRFRAKRFYDDHQEHLTAFIDTLREALRDGWPETTM